MFRSSLSSSQNSPIKSIQSYEINIATGTTSTTQSLSPAVNPKYAYVVKNGMYINGNDVNGNICEISLTLASDGSSVTAAINTADSGGGSGIKTVACQVVEWEPWAVVDVQHGTITLGGSATSAFSSALARTVNPAMSAIIYQGFTTTYANQQQQYRATCLTLDPSGTKVGATRQAQNGTDSNTIPFSVIEWRPSVVSGVQQATISFSGTTQTQTASISSVVTANSVLFWQGCLTDAFLPELTDVALTNSTTLTATGGASVSSIRTNIVSVVSFKPRFCKTKMAARDLMTGGAAPTVVNNGTYTVNKGRTIINHCGTSGTGGFADSSLFYADLIQTANNNVRSSVPSTNFSQNCTNSWNGMEFHG